MARDPQGALVALNRFGFGARGGAASDFSSAASDPRGFVKAELGRPNAALLDAPGLQPTPVLAQAVFDYQKDVKQQRENAARTAEAMASSSAGKPSETKAAAGGEIQGESRTDMMSNGAVPDAMSPKAAPPKEPPKPLNIIQKTFRAEALARLQRATMAECGFVERLVTFWSNHFCISANKGELARMWSGAFEREAIRPHVLGNFGEMLRAVEQHPAMIFFLDNQQSIGPDSRAGQNRKKGLNENLAREIMELHTLGVNGGYTQADVTSLARIITGWTFAGRQAKLGAPGTFIFNANAHEPGPQKLLGKVYEDTGLAQGEAALADIARHPATAKFIATKFVRHFIADDPPPALVAKLEATFRKTGGDLRAMTLALVDADEAWRAPMTKIRMPYEYLVASGRMMGRIPEEPQRYLGGLNVLGQPLWTPAGPNGFADTNAAWAAPENIKLRLDIASQISSRIADSIDPRALLDVVAGEAASTETRQTIERAESKQQAFALLLMSPEFQRR
ncbi:MAG TPA: DUF1800 domain-containing protein [Afipia sp.]|uniref:DUF1800 domain-containing protein n=1 Tax=unclassified Afipia TaxID=2642050 RepID=UPI000467261B|nr:MULTISPECIES: DUF1800 family protein [unclassified Afipia]MAH68629.1 DUF1800 domain-containing protein [Afipia sp.]OUX62212.1 MAG: hypothetical protein CBB64_05240 [Afipia sp. TMED4]HAO41023.1 DUF1800 domain-containing protein [Afipia sp.]HAQ92715.1 DUF1800 domain-containing protein [Afipia sp.]HBF52998.1 DUF1800 domain-containing protein [Afipia sp.]